jgi:hypothetical protein
MTSGDYSCSDETSTLESEQFGSRFHVSPVGGRHREEHDRRTLARFDPDVTIDDDWRP